MVKKICTSLSMLIMSTICAFSQNGKMDVFINDLMRKMTVEEKIGQLNLPTIGVTVTGPILSKNVEANIRNGFVGGVLNTHGVNAVKTLQDLAVKNTRLKIPLFFGLDVIHGHTTLFPIPLGLASSWDMNIIEKSARIAAEESTADGVDWTFSPMVDIARDPRWGRVAEGAGEDPYLGSLIAKAMVKGYQQDDLKKPSSIMACVKHFALYGAAEGGRDYNTVDMSLVKMYQSYLPPYKSAVDAGVESVMTSFNEINGIPSTANKWLLTDLLRKQWGFKGFVVTDYTAINEMHQHGLGDDQKVSLLALKAGVDMDMVGEEFLNNLHKLLKEGKITLSEIDAACRRILVAKYKLGLFEDPYKNLHDNSGRGIFTESNRNAAMKIAEHCMVLLKNNNHILPLKKTQTIALIGPLANSRRDVSGPHAAASDWQKSVSVMDGFKNMNGVKFIYAKGAAITDDSLLLNQLNSDGGGIEKDSKSGIQLIDEAVEAANKSDVIVAVVGETQGMSGEAASRSDIGLPQAQKELLKALVKTGKPLVLVLMNGRPLTLEWENKNSDAILETWFAGTEAGNAIADVLYGGYNPSAKVTMSFPVNVGQIPVYYNHKNTGRPYEGALIDKYRSRYLDVSNDPLFPFGFGLSYTSFNYGDIIIDKKTLIGEDNLNASLIVTNTGSLAGEEIVQLYVSQASASVTRPVKELKGFQKILLQPGESKKVTFNISVNDLKFFNTDLKYVWEPGEIMIQIGTNSRDVKSLAIQWKR